MTSWTEKRALLVGVGGLGSPAAIVLAEAGVGTIGLADDDEVELTNLHRQILFTDADVGRSKVLVAAESIARWSAGKTRVVVHRTRLLPDNARDLVRAYDVVLEGSDNFATKFLTADACFLEHVPVVHASAVRWHGTALAVGPHGRACYRCLFEDIPHEQVPNCAEAGVMGPVVGIVAAAQADLALRVLLGEPRHGELVTFDGRTDAYRRRTVAPRPDCPLCSMARIQSLDASRYLPGSCEL